jgi:hypothetical protein
MPTGIPHKGYRRTKKLEGKTLADIEKELAFRVPDFVNKLEELTRIQYCPNCNAPVRGVDRDAIIYLIDRAMGKPTQKHELDVTQTIQLSADDCDKLIERFQIAQRALLPEAIVGEYKEVE